MQLFLRKMKGSITVLVTLILIPTIFFTGFLVDLARIKLYSSQAVMTADNYGETVLTYYDNILKELYGLFAVTQNEEALAELKELDDYIKSSFDPNDSTISWENLQPAVGTTNYDGFMPYSSADVTLAYEAVEGANLANNEVISTQIGDFMKFYIVQSMLNDDEGLLNALDELQGMQDDAVIVKMKKDVDEKAGEALDAASAYFQTLDKIEKYPDYLTKLKDRYAQTISTFDYIAGSTSYETYYNYTKNAVLISAAIQKKNSQGEEALTDKEKEYIKMNEDYQNDYNAWGDNIKAQFDSVIGSYTACMDSDPVDFDNFKSLADQLSEEAEAVRKVIDDLGELTDDLKTELEDAEITDSLRDGIKSDLQQLDDLFMKDGVYSEENYVNLANDIRGNVGVNSSYSEQANKIQQQMEIIRDAYLNVEDDIPAWCDDFDENKWFNFRDDNNYDTLYNSLKQCFQSADSDTDNEKKAKSKKKDAEDKIEEAEKSLQNETTNARNIPKEFGFGDEGSGNKFILSKVIDTAASYFKTNSLAQTGNKLLLKFYMVEYDFQMFSNRMTNNKPKQQSNDVDNNTGQDGQEAEEEKKVSLTGYEIGSNINYLYQAELEYIFGGYNSSKSNLEAARNKILAFRAVTNIAATYTIKEVNSSINTISSFASVINPLLGFGVSAALRLAVAGLETLADWNKLMEGESVVLIKSKVQDLTAYESIKDLLDLQDDVPDGPQEKKLALDYEQYLMLMIMFLTTSEELASRTANLICLNVNTVQQNIGAEGTLEELEFTMDNAYTAVNATCAVHMDFVVIPQGFSRQVLDDETYGELESFEKNTYKFTVTRGY